MTLCCVDKLQSVVKPLLHNLYLETDQDWLDSILNDDISRAKDLLSKHHNKKDILLNGNFDNKLTTEYLKTEDLVMYYVAHKPLCLASANGSQRVLEFLLGEGVNPLDTIDHGGFNIIHCLLASVFFRPGQQHILNSTYNLITNVLPEKSLKELLLQESNDGLRPLEMASKLGLTWIVKYILQTKGVYVKKIENHGPMLCYWIDITDYETLNRGHRRDKSPIKLLVELDETDLERVGTKELFEWSVLKTWTKGKMSYNKPFVIMWMLFRIVLILMIYVVDGLKDAENMINKAKAVGSNTQNSSISSSNITLGMFSQSMQLSPCWEGLNMFIYIISIRPQISSILSYAICVACSVNIVIMIKERTLLLFKRYNSNSGTVVDSFKQIRRPIITSYNFIDFLFSLISIVYVMIDNNMIIYAILNFTIIWYSLYFAQILPNSGYFVVMLKKSIMYDALPFFCVFLLCLIPFGYGFAKLSTVTGTCDVFVSNDLLSFIYNSFTVFLNTVNFNNALDKLPVLDQVALFALHMTFVMYLNIVLVNLLIAMLSNTIAVMAQNKNIIMCLQRQSVLLSVESYASKLFKCYYQRKQKCIFVVENERIYIIETCYRHT